MLTAKMIMKNERFNRRPTEYIVETPVHIENHTNRKPKIGPVAQNKKLNLARTLDPRIMESEYYNNPNASPVRPKFSSTERPTPKNSRVKFQYLMKAHNIDNRRYSI